MLEQLERGMKGEKKTEEERRKDGGRDGSICGV